MVYSVEPKVRLQGYGYNPFCSHSSRCLAVLVWQYFEEAFCAPKVRLKWYGFKGFPSHSSHCSGGLFPQYSGVSPFTRPWISRARARNICASDYQAGKSLAILRNDKRPGSPGLKTSSEIGNSSLQGYEKLPKHLCYCVPVQSGRDGWSLTALGWLLEPSILVRSSCKTNSARIFPPGGTYEFRCEFYDDYFRSTLAFVERVKRWWKIHHEIHSRIHSQIHKDNLGKITDLYWWAGAA